MNNAATHQSRIINFVSQGQGEALPIGSGPEQYFATGSLTVLKLAMDICAQFQATHPPPSTEEELVEYCTALGIALQKLHTVSADKAGGKPNLNQISAGCSSRVQQHSSSGSEVGSLD